MRVLGENAASRSDKSFIYTPWFASWIHYFINKLKHLSFFAILLIGINKDALIKELKKAIHLIQGGAIQFNHSVRCVIKRGARLWSNSNFIHEQPVNGVPNGGMHS
jgi:hypothetical protein